MGTRLRLALCLILSSIILWFVIIVFNWPKDEKNDIWTLSSTNILGSSEDHSWTRAQGGSSSLQDAPGFAPKGRRASSERKTFPNVIQDSKYSLEHMSAIDTIFYQLNLHSKSADHHVEISQSEHEQNTLKLGSIHNDADEYVKLEGDRRFAFNLLVSNRVGLFRPIPDTRHLLCRMPKVKSLSITNQTSSRTDSHTNESVPKSPMASEKVGLPRASIIICYYNEAPSALLRTIYTLIRRSPSVLLEEILIIDDYSDSEFHVNKLKSFLSDVDMVSLHRTSKREGLIRARLFGSRRAKGDVLIFLDSHVEANKGWLEPLLEQVKANRTTVACPMIDLINSETLIYTASPMVIGGLTWALHFKWDSISSKRLKNYHDFVKPQESATMAGGLYAIDREFFKHLGEYDSGMNLWGGENVEFSLRIWMCGGRIVILPCSRFGHIFRKRRPYGPKPDEPDSLLYNSHRAARVWLDQYISMYYDASPLARQLNSGDIGERLDLRQRLDCMNFSWFIDNVYPSLGHQIRHDQQLDLSSSTSKGSNIFKINRKRVDRSAQRALGLQKIDDAASKIQHDSNLDGSETRPPARYSHFQIQSFGSKLCIESRESQIAKGFNRLVLGHCFGPPEAELTRENPDSYSSDRQLWLQSDDHEYRLGDNQCLDLVRNLPTLRRCHGLGFFQDWRRNNQSSSVNIYNSKTGLCLGVERVLIGEPVIATLCDIDNLGVIRSLEPDISGKGLTNTSKIKRLQLAKEYSAGVAPLRSSDIQTLVPSQKWSLVPMNMSLEV